VDINNFILQTVSKIVAAFKRGNTLFIIGNGGSAAESQHMSAELVGRYKLNRRALPAIALTTDTPILTAIANDFGFKYVFSRQLEALGKAGDVLLILTTSGRSENCNFAKQTAEIMGIETIQLPFGTKDTATSQEKHLGYIHKICELVEKEFA
jgi:D-sedoheptulose 7-phosphate isomerase